MNVLVAGDEGALSLAGAPAPDRVELVVVLDDAPAPAAGEAPVLRWWRGTAEPGRAGERTLATAGEGLWSRAPWPVRDEVFDLERGPAGAVLVAEPDAEIAAGAVAALERAGLACERVDALCAEALERADVVVLGTGEARPLPGDAPAVLAAGRLLVANPAPAFGLAAGVHYLAADGPYRAAEVIATALRWPDAFASLRRAGRIAAEAHRAGDVYARLLTTAR